MSITGSSCIRRLKDCPVVIGLHALSSVGRRTTGERGGRRLERFAEMCQDLPDRPRLGDGRDASDVATTHRALEQKLLSHPGHEFGLWRREGSWERGLSHESQRSPMVSPPAAASRRLPTFQMARAVTADLSL